MKEIMGTATINDSVTYDVRTCAKNEEADNKDSVTSQTAGKTHREPGNLDAAWNLTLYKKAGLAKPAAGQTIKLQLKADTRPYTMIVDAVESSTEYDYIALHCSANCAESY